VAFLSLSPGDRAALAKNGLILPEIGRAGALLFPPHFAKILAR
jgi:hypothetical protein